MMKKREDGLQDDYKGSVIVLQAVCNRITEPL